jgi:uncharacterized phage protein gp47/JayE
MFETQTYTEILNRLKSQAPSGIDSTEGSFIHDALSPAALEMAQLYANLDVVLTLAFAQTTNGQYLDYRAGEHGLERKAAVCAAGTIKVTGNQGIVIPQGQIFVTDGGMEFVTTESATIPAEGSVLIKIQAKNPGVTGNVPAGNIKKAQAAIPGVISINNENPVTGGVDEETDESLLNRLLEKVRNPATSGNASHYLQWAKEVVGVGDAKVFPLWNGNGTVKVVIVNSEKKSADQALVTDTANYIESVRPVGATVTVESAIPLDLNITASVTLAEGYTIEQVTTSFQDLFTDYLQEIALKQIYVSYAKIGSTLLETPGILDYKDLIVNGDTGNVPVDLSAADCQVAVIGTVTLSV